jgi:hypothetical protein
MLTAYFMHADPDTCLSIERRVLVSKLVRHIDALCDQVSFVCMKLTHVLHLYAISSSSLWSV